MRRGWITVLFISLLLFNLIPAHSQTYNFEFTTTDNEIRNINDYSDKPIVLDWAASWCSICKENQKAFNRIYDQYQSDVNFISISFGGSGDDIDDVKLMKGAYPWTFGFDHSNAYEDYDVANGYVWILTVDLSLAQEWEYTVVSEDDLTTAIDAVLAGEDPLQDTGPDEGGSNFGEDEVNSYGLQGNPLFIGFLAMISVIMIILISKSGSDDTSSTKKDDVLKKTIEEKKDEWDWHD